MTSKTFKSAGNPEAEISVVPSADGVRTVHVHGIEASGVTVPREDAPALALAILEAAWWPNEHLATTEILRRLRELDEHVKAVEAEARERAELEAEALELFNVNQGINLPDWGNADWAVISSWVRVARRAREIAKEATK